jgi:hypothetical protein
VSRALSRFQGLGLLKAELRSVSILDPDALGPWFPTAVRRCVTDA